MSPKSLEGYYDHLKKQGLARFYVIFKSAPDDIWFSEHDPVAIVIITATDPTNGKNFTLTSQMSNDVKKLEAKIPVLNIVGGFKRVWNRVIGKEKPKPYKVVITVKPHPDWEHLYSSKEFLLKNVHPGPNPPQHVWMLRKSDEKWRIK